MKHAIAIMAMMMVAASTTAQPLDLETPTQATQWECDVALTIAAANPPFDNRNVWPVLGIDADDQRLPLDCRDSFEAAGLPGYATPPQKADPAVPAKQNQYYRRPVLISPENATIREDISLRPHFKQATTYTLTRKDGKWVVVSKKIMAIT